MEKLGRNFISIKKSRGEEGVSGSEVLMNWVNALKLKVFSEACDKSFVLFFHEKRLKMLQLMSDKLLRDTKYHVCL